MSGETENGHGKWRLYGPFTAIKDLISSSVGFIAAFENVNVKVRSNGVYRRPG